VHLGVAARFVPALADARAERRVERPLNAPKVAAGAVLRGARFDARPMWVAPGRRAAARVQVGQRLGEEAGTTITVVPAPVRPVSPFAPS